MQTAPGGKAVGALARATFKQWAPVLGDEVARKLSQAWTWRLLRLPTALVLLVGINVCYIAHTLASFVTLLCLIGILIASAATLTALWRAGVNATSDLVLSKLGPVQAEVLTRPDFRDPGAFERWARDAGFSSEQLDVLRK